MEYLGKKKYKLRLEVRLHNDEIAENKSRGTVRLRFFQLTSSSKRDRNFNRTIHSKSLVF
jgi:hypothetical protein